jgi:predicted RNA-binding protein with PUA-like domain
MGYWLLKTEPDTFGVEHLAARARRTAPWDGVRNYQARNYLRDEVRRGDLAFIYHSSCAQPGIAGIASVVRAAYADPSAFERRNPHFDASSDPANPRWFAIDVRLQRRLKRIITLDELRAHEHGKLLGMLLLRRGNRLSVTPVSAAHWQFILTLE